MKYKYHRYRRTIKISVSKAQADWFNSLTAVEKFAVLCMGEAFMSLGEFLPEDMFDNEIEEENGGRGLYIDIHLGSVRKNKLSSKFVQLLLSRNHTLADVHIAQALQYYFAFEREKQEDRFAAEIAEHFTFNEEATHYSDYHNADAESFPITGIKIASKTAGHSSDETEKSDANVKKDSSKDLSKPPKPPATKIHFTDYNHKHKGQNHEEYDKALQQSEAMQSEAVRQKDNNITHRALEEQALKHSEISPIIRELQGMFD